MDLFRAIPQVVTVHAMRKKSYARHWGKLLARTLGTRWDIVVDIRNSITAFIVRSNQRFSLKPNHGLHRVVHIARLMKVTPPPAPYIWTDQKKEDALKATFPKCPVIALAPFSNWQDKSWPLENYLALAKQLTAPEGLLPKAHIMLHGSKEEKNHLAAFTESFSPQDITNAAGCSIMKAAILLKHSHCYIGNDSGLTHMAAAVGTPTLALFGPTRDDLYAPWGPKASFVRAAGTIPNSKNAIKKLTVPQVILSLTRLLNSIQYKKERRG